jgi:hypothetical protein
MGLGAHVSMRSPRGGGAGLSGKIVREHRLRAGGNGNKIRQARKRDLFSGPGSNNGPERVRAPLAWPEEAGYMIISQRLGQVC